MDRSKSLNPSGAVFGSHAFISLKVWIVRPPESRTIPSSLLLELIQKKDYRNGAKALPNSIRRCGSNEPSMDTSTMGTGHGLGNMSLKGTKTP
jgi:hypothetical protein